MKKIILSVVIFIFLAGCNSNGTINEQKIDAAGDKLQKTVETTADTIVKKVDSWADSLGRDKKRDSVY